MFSQKRRKSIPRTLFERYGPTKLEFYRAQGGICPLCGKGMTKLEECNFDHVHPHSQGGDVLGNIVLTHTDCNSRRPGTKKPCKAYRQILDLVNDQLGWNDEVYTNCIGAYHRKLEKAIVALHWDNGIKMARYSRSFRLYGINPEDLEALVYHFNQIFKIEAFKPVITDNGNVYFVFKHRGFK